MLAACNRQAPVLSQPPAVPSGEVGYVRMGVLLQAHPLYAELARLDEDVRVLELHTAGDLPGQSHAEIIDEEQAMRRELDRAVEHTRKELAEIRSAYVRQENAAIAEIFAQSGSSGSGTDAIEQRMAATSREQVRNIDQQARENFRKYRAQVVAQSNAALANIRQSFLDRADRAYHAQVDVYMQREATLTLDQAQRDGPERLLLRTRLADLALDTHEKASAKARLDQLGKQEANELGALHTSDQAMLASYRAQLQANVHTELAGEAQDIQVRTHGSLEKRARQVQTEIIGQLGVMPMPAPLPSVAAGALPADARAKLDTLHKHYQAAYERDADQTVREFSTTRDLLSNRFKKLAGIDASAQESARKEIEALRAQRKDLYTQMIAQINREVRSIANRRGIGVVVVKGIVPVGGHDLTTEVLGDIESLHE
jgi:hypothetical protein